MKTAKIILTIATLLLSFQLIMAFGNDQQIQSSDSKDTTYQYLPGDANMYRETWPPQTIGSDVTFLVKYFSLLPAYPPCIIDGFWASADVNGDCRIMLDDITRLVKYFQGIAQIKYCPDYPPAWHTRFEVPAAAPPGWPDCH
jgi:hypothetical protein